MRRPREEDSPEIRRKQRTHPERDNLSPLLFSSPEKWALLARAAALQYGVFLVIANRAGVEEGVTFAGESTVVGPTGEILASAPQREPATLDCTLPRDDLRRGRTPFAHLRDEDPGFVRRALDQIRGDEVRHFICLTPSNAHRFSTIITGVIREALRYSGRSAVMVVGGGPEEALLESWLGDAHIPFQPAPRKVMERMLPILKDLEDEESQPPGTSTDPALTQRASELAGQAVASARDLLLLGTANKTSLLLSFSTSVQPVLPLGDLYASQIQEMSGDCTVPGALRGISAKELSAVDSALRAYFEGGLPPETAFGELEPERSQQVREMLEESRRRWHPLPLIPKLGDATLGMDLDL